MSATPCDTSPTDDVWTDLEALRLEAVAWMAARDWPAVTVEPDEDGRRHLAYVDDPDEPTWVEIDPESDTPAARQLVAGLLRVAEVHVAAAVGLAWHAYFAGEGDEVLTTRRDQPTELVGIGLYDPSRPLERPTRLRGPFELSADTLRFLVTALRAHNALLPAGGDGVQRWGLFPWCDAQDER